MPRISIVTATFNRREFLARCVESVAAQPYDDKEHVIIDGASTDGSMELLRELAARYPHLRWISEPDRGLSHAFNKGLRLATGDFIGVLGDDDRYEPNVFPRVAQAFAEHPEAGVVAGNCYYERGDGTRFKTLRASFTTRADLLQHWRFWGTRVTIPATSAFLRREVVQEIGVFDERDRFAMDYRHWIKIAARFPIVTVDEVWASFRFDDLTISGSRAREQQREAINISRQYWGAPTKTLFWRMVASYLLHFKVRLWVGNALRRILRRESLRRPETSP